MTTASVSAIEDYIGKETGVSEWVYIDQRRIDRFAQVTGDHQFIHVDADKAARSPFGGTIAHGFLTLSLLGGLAEGNTLILKDAKMGVNYGLEGVRFLAPVPVNSSVRARFTLAEAQERSPNVYQFIHETVVEIQDRAKPALAARWMTLQYL